VTLKKSTDYFRIINIKLGTGYALSKLANINIGEIKSLPMINLLTLISVLFFGTMLLSKI